MAINQTAKWHEWQCSYSWFCAECYCAAEWARLAVRHRHGRLSAIVPEKRDGIPSDRVSFTMQSRPPPLSVSLSLPLSPLSPVRSPSSSCRPPPSSLSLSLPRAQRAAPKQVSQSVGGIRKKRKPQDVGRCLRAAADHIARSGPSLTRLMQPLKQTLFNTLAAF